MKHMKHMKHMKTPRIFVYIKNGNIQQIFADQEIEIMAIDGDYEGREYYREFLHPNKSKLRGNIAWNSEVDVAPKTVEHFFKQR